MNMIVEIKPTPTGLTIQYWKGSEGNKNIKSYIEEENYSSLATYWHERLGVQK